jgi:arabinogalactan endo-1,4-beta-galactosidase
VITGRPCICGADLSLLGTIPARGGLRDHAGRAIADPARFLRQAGFEWARLRLFHTPSGHGAQVNDLPYTLALARTLKQAGFKFLLDLHYSDTWADPGKQYTPKAWASLDFAGLVDTVHAYTLETVNRFVAEGATPEMVQVGNEITPGMLWEHGRVTRSHTTDTQQWKHAALSDDREPWKRFGLLLKAGVAGVKEAAGTTAQIMLHLDRGGDIPTNQWFFDNVLEQNVPFDVIGESYYPFWHGMPDGLAQTIEFLGNRYGDKVYLAEIAYPYKHHPMYENALSGDPAAWHRLVGKYPLTPEGQCRFVADVLAIVRASKYCGGVFYWAPEWIPPQDPAYEDEADAPPCWARALFDDRGRALPALEVFSKQEHTTWTNSS